MYQLKNWSGRLAACGAVLGMMFGLLGCTGGDEAARGAGDEPYVEVVPNEAAQRVDVRVGGELFTSYIYSDDLPVLKKPVLYPIRLPSGTAITRNFPLDPGPGERVDHPHHIGLWLNYGDVNGLDFWNNSDAIDADRADEMGTVRHAAVREVESGEGEGVLETTSYWLNPGGERLLREDTRYVFHAEEDGARFIDRITTLTALDERVTFDDNKEGMLGLRVTRALEMPSERPVLLTDASGQAMEERVVDNEGVTGRYRNSEGVAGYPDVWGKRAKWMTLSGEVEGEPVTVAIFDHPQNVGYPTYWHARDYGLFAANPLGQRAFSEGAEELNFALAPGESTTFRHRVAVFPEDATPEEVEAAYGDFASE